MGWAGQYGIGRGDIGLEACQGDTTSRYDGALAGRDMVLDQGIG